MYVGIGEVEISITLVVKDLCVEPKDGDFEDALLRAVDNITAEDVIRDGNWNYKAILLDRYDPEEESEEYGDDEDEDL